MGNFKDAFENQKLFNAFSDSLKNFESKRMQLQAEMNYEFDKKSELLKEKTNAEIKEHILKKNIAIGSFIIVFLFMILIYFQSNKIKKEKVRSDALLLNILPEQVADELKSQGKTNAKFYNQVTVLFTDFKGFTSLSEKLSPQELVNELNTCFTAFDHIMQKHHIEKIKTIGDAYMAVGGLPIPNENHAKNAVNAALDIKDYMKDYILRQQSLGLPFFEIRIGVHSGPVVAGVVGFKKFAYDVWGDTVNTASRIESNSEIGKINISESTYELIKDDFICTYRGKVSAKGKGELAMYYVESIA